MKNIPAATYRLQFNRRFAFTQATGILDYLGELGISHVYASPLLQAGPNSSHGYDVCNFEQLNHELGTEKDFENFIQQLHQLGLGLLLDFVPNHMGAALENPFWFDVLEKGRASPYANWFDIDWQPACLDLSDKILLPILEDHYFRVLEQGKLQLRYTGGRLSVAYYERLLPLSPLSYFLILEQLQSISQQGHLSDVCERALKSFREFAQSKPSVSIDDGKFAAAQKLLLELHNGSQAFRLAFDRVLKTLNGVPGRCETFKALDAILDRQHYRLAFWRVAAEELNYRRFFDVTGLVCLRVEAREVFEASHKLAMHWVRANQVNGLRIDHPDGLFNPKEYFERVQRSEGPLYTLAEKILSGNEELPSDWAVDGTTGYDFLNQVNGLFVDGANANAMTRLYAEFTGVQDDFDVIARRSKRKILEYSLASELTSLTYRLSRIAKQTRYGKDFTFTQLRHGIIEIIAAFPVYRTYITPDTSEPTLADRESLRVAVQLARGASPPPEPAVLDFIEDLLLLQPPLDLPEPHRAGARDWVMRFQQLTGPATAKGVEDTAFYIYHRLASLNEVGGSPGRFGVSVSEFHAYNLRHAQKWPHSLLATATHDTKRGEDVRARLNVLSEMPGEWGAAVRNWNQLNAVRKSSIRENSVPDLNDEYLLYQVLVGAWCEDAEMASGQQQFCERITAYMLKALRECKERTSWISPNNEYEQATASFIEAVLGQPFDSPFYQSFRPFQQTVAFFGRFNSLAQTLLKLTTPGVPDIYQGTEFWDLSLVDPDNRRSVDFTLRRQALYELKQAANKGFAETCAFLLRQDSSAHLKLYVLWRALACRREYRNLFEDGAYIPLTVTGPQQDHICAFAREMAGKFIVTVVPRLVYKLVRGEQRPPLGPDIWGNTRVMLPEGADNLRFQNVFTNEVVSAGQGGLNLAELLAVLPVALLKPA